MNETIRILLLAAAAILGGLAINLFLLFLFRNNEFIRRMRGVQRFTAKLRNPWREQQDAYNELHKAVEKLQNPEGKNSHTAPSDDPDSPAINDRFN
ncbi:MAG: hypothetical protein JXA25_03410 [Anaerolineales bacterium]|nr:hypothetical protein [Anaerolineales bacterium]